MTERLGALGEAAGLDLIAHGTISDADTIRDTAVAQPLIVAAGLVALHVLRETSSAPRPYLVTAGHSVGEITAAVAAGVLTEGEAIRFVATRGRAMAKASAVQPTGMSAVLGGDPDEVIAVIERHGLTPANRNGGGQVVAAGTLEQLAAFAADPPAKARVIPLQVAGAFHTRHMAPAVAELAELAAAMSPADPAVHLLSNADGRAVATGAEALNRMVGQVSNPVRWDLCQATLLDLGVTTVIELPPAGTLSNLAKRSMTGVATVAIKTPGDLDAALAAIDAAPPQSPAQSPTTATAEAGA